MGDGNFSIFFNRPISAVFMIIAFFLFLFPAIQVIRGKIKAGKAEAA
jgi:TctA family transporter